MGFASWQRYYAQHSSGGRQANFAALNRGCHLYSAGRPSRWALAHILVLLFIVIVIEISLEHTRVVVACWFVLLSSSIFRTTFDRTQSVALQIRMQIFIMRMITRERMRVDSLNLFTLCLYLFHKSLPP